MSFALFWPGSAGEWLAFASALVTVGFGVLLVVAPGWSLRVLRLRTAADHPEALSEARATMAGFYLGVGLTAIVFAQPLLWIALGAGWAFTALGRLVSIVADGGNTPFNWGSLAFEAVLALLPLAHAFGLV